MLPVNYIDPGTGSVLVGSVWGVISTVLAMAAAFLVAYFLNPHRRQLSRFRKSRWFFPSMTISILALFISGYPLLFNGFTFQAIGDEMMEGKVLIIGIDAMDPDVMESMMEEGRLPNFGKLETFSRLETTIPPETPVAWSAAATGTNPGGYGIFDFITRDPGKYLPRLTLTEESRSILGTRYSSGMKGVPFWRITSGKGIPTSVIRWPVTFPPERVNGRMLSGLGTFDIKGLLNSYSFYTTGDLESREGESGKIIRVEGDGVIHTKVYGPLVRKGEESSVPMEIGIHDDSVTVKIGGKDYEVNKGGWSEWIRARFRIDPFTEVSGIFRLYLISTKPDLAMYMTSVQIDPEDPLMDISYPKEYSGELSGSIGLFYTMGMPEDTKAVDEGRLPREVFYEQIEQIEEERERMFWHEFGRFGEGVLAFAFDAGDRMQHIFWRGDGMVPEVEKYYEKKDEFLGKVLESMDDNTCLIIFSDHGFSNFERAVDINRWLVENGYMVLTQEPEDDGALFKYVDWSRTKAYSLGFAGMFINLKGREGQGIVEEKDMEMIINEIIGKLLELEDGGNGKRVITRLYRGSEIYHGKNTGNAPDIMIGFEPGYRMSWQTAIGGMAESVIADNDREWKGDHLVDRSHVPGVLFANFRIEKENPSLMDIAPTILEILNIDIPEEMDGEPLVSE